MFINNCQYLPITYNGEFDFFVGFFSSALNSRSREKYNTCGATRPLSDFAKVVIRCHLLYTFHFTIIKIIYNKINDVDARDVPSRNIAPR